MSFNKAIILGRLGQDPDTKPIQGGSMCIFSVATSETFNGRDGQKQERTEWHKVVVFGKLAEICTKYLSKGSQALVEGKLQTRSWEDKNGQKQFSTEIVASSVQFLDQKKKPEEENNEIPF